MKYRTTLLVVVEIPSFGTVVWENNFLARIAANPFPDLRKPKNKNNGSKFS
ncbi:MAG: hypothetical protein V7K50_13505 [Nostoc sp.]|uniref:hypothetical protein n=1 Tax=Nostoc sp. TaxID=1180 RepID=UPI002FFBB44C